MFNTARAVTRLHHYVVCIRLLTTLTHIHTCARGRRDQILVICSLLVYEFFELRKHGTPMFPVFSFCDHISVENLARSTRAYQRDGVGYRCTGYFSFVNLKLIGALVIEYGLGRHAFNYRRGGVGVCITSNERDEEPFR